MVKIIINGKNIDTQESLPDSVQKMLKDKNLDGLPDIMSSLLSKISPEAAEQIKQGFKLSTQNQNFKAINTLEQQDNIIQTKPQIVINHQKVHHAPAKPEIHHVKKVHKEIIPEPMLKTSNFSWKSFLLALIAIAYLSFLIMNYFHIDLQ